MFLWTTDRPLGATDWPGFKRTSARTGAVAVALRAPNGTIATMPAIQAHWTALGGDRSPVGIAAGKEYTVPGGVAQNFATGKIFWSPATRRPRDVGRPAGAVRGPRRAGRPTGAADDGRDPHQGRRCLQRHGGRAAHVAPAHRRVGGFRGDEFDCTTGSGAEWGPLGYPVSGEGASSVPGVVVQGFQGGATYWSADRGARAVWGEINVRWRAYGGERGPLGVPLTSEAGTGAGGVMAQFAGGRAYWHPSAGAHVVYGAILATYLAAGGPTGRLGTPTSSEHDVPGGRANDFAGGMIRWDAATGAVTLTLR